MGHWNHECNTTRAPMDKTAGI